ncbi:MAG: AAA family ATPase, partial [Candidatus Fermentibacteria bacterium]|nr:AAA family ATPase [Candidatus Fermentibacteria bacterium]
DMTGFTRLTDQAMRLGDGGAEWISSILSRSFSPFIEFVEEEGGFIAEFEGDAALAVFRGDRPELLYRSQQLLEEVSKKVGEGITFSAASGSGDVHWGVSGSAGILYQLFHGASVADAFNFDNSIPSNEKWMEAAEGTSRFFPSLITGKDFGGEFRTVFPAFLSLQVSSIHEAQVFFKSVCDFTSAMDGFLNGTYLRENRATALVVFGAPRAHESDARRCGELVTGLMKLFPALRAGISAGSAYAGFVGSGNRCDYTVLGSMVNLASRLCGSAEEGEIFANGQYTELVRQFFKVEHGRSLHLKGFTDPQQCYSISDSVIETGNDFRSGRFVGRAEERKKLLDLFSSSVQHGKLSTVNIFGEPGIGKSRLLDDCLTGPGQDVFKLVLSGDEFMSARDFHPWKKALKYISERLFSDLLKNTELGDLRSELQWAEGCLIRLSDDSSETVSDENLAYSISVLLDSVARTGRFIIGIENPGSMDSQSLHILESFLDRQASARGMVVSTCRLEEELPEFLRSDSSINLGPFSVQETIEKLSVDTGFTVMDSIAKTLHKRSAGNPLYLEELSSIIQQDQLKGTWSTWHDMEHLLPASLGSLLESRVDRLSGEMREAVCAASVLGHEFDPEILRHMMPVRSASITKGLSLGIWKISRQGKLVFRHDLIRQTSYRMLLVSTRKSIHQLAADVIVKLHPEPEGEQLVYLAMHAAKADSIETALKYLETAGDYCRSAHRNQLAIDLYTELERFTQDAHTGMRAKGKKGAVLEVVGRWNEAIDIYRNSVEIADSDPDMVQHSGRMRISLGRLLMQQGHFDQAITVLEEAESILSGSHETVLAPVFANLGGSWLRKGEFHKAEGYLNRWRDVSERTGDKHSLAMVMGTLGVLADEVGETEKAREFYLSQAELAK